MGVVFSISNFFINKISQGKKSVRGLAAAIYLSSTYANSKKFGNFDKFFWPSKTILTLKNLLINLIYLFFSETVSSKAYLVGNETLVVPASVATEAEDNQGDWQTAQREPQHDGVNFVKQSD